MATTISQEDLKKRDALLAAYNRIPKTEKFDNKRMDAFDELMAHEDSITGNKYNT